MDETQVHTHMCSSEFNQIIDAIATMDADVISIETSRSKMEVLDPFTSLRYPNEIGPGVYDIHSPHVPEAGEIVELLDLAHRRIPDDRLWVNSDCGLQTRTWEDVRPVLVNVIARRGRPGQPRVKNSWPPSHTLTLVTALAVFSVSFIIPAIERIRFRSGLQGRSRTVRAAAERSSG